MLRNSNFVNAPRFSMQRLPSCRHCDPSFSTVLHIVIASNQSRTFGDTFSYTQGFKVWPFSEWPEESFSLWGQLEQNKYWHILRFVILIRKLQGNSLVVLISKTFKPIQELLSIAGNGYPSRIPSVSSIADNAKTCSKLESKAWLQGSRDGAPKRSKEFLKLRWIQHVVWLGKDCHWSLHV